MTKIDIVSGFLGAGKTTLIKKMLEEVFSGEKVVLVENEYGEVGIDGGFLKDSGIEIRELNSGCICCSLVGDFSRSLKEVIETYHPDRILIEPSGVGKLSDVMSSVKKMEGDYGDVKLNALVTVANAMKVSKQMKAFGEFFNNQIENATTIVLSRTQNAKPEKLELSVHQIQQLNPKAAIITTPWDEITGGQILKVIEGQKSLMDEMMAEFEADHEHHHDHDHDHEHEHHYDHGHDHDDMSMNIIMTTTISMSIIMTMIITITTMRAVMTTIMITMQMKCLPAGDGRLPTSSPESRSRRS